MRIEVPFSTRDLALTRFARSPMWQVVSAYRQLATGGTEPGAGRWVDQVRPRLTAIGLHEGWLADLIPAGRYIPDFLNPPPTEPAPALATELAAIARTPRARIAQDVDHFPAPTRRLKSLASAPDTHLPRLIEEINAFWDLAIAPYWARVRALLDADIYHRARQVAEYGTGHLLNDLHATVSWSEDTLRLVQRQCTMFGTTGSGIILVPSAFNWPKVLTWHVPPDMPQLAYPARGLGTLWEPREVAHADALAGVLGRSRVRLLIELDAPASTKDLALRTGISSAGVSQHLTSLRDAGMVSAHRAGRSVLYARTTVAESLLADRP